MLESKEVLRSSVTRAEVLDLGESSVTLRTFAVVRSRKEISSADPEMQNLAKLAAAGEAVEGRLRLDVLSDNVVRVRYAEGDRVPENETPMVVGRPAAPGRVEADRRGGVAFTTDAMRVNVFLDPERIEVRLPDGRLVCAIGGPEMNNFNAWDSYNTGVSRTVGGARVATESFDLAHDECVYGFGESFIKLNKVGQTIDLDITDAVGVATPRMYKGAPFFVSTKGYGVFFNHSSRMTFWVGSLCAADVQVAAEDDFLDYYVITGDIKRVLSTYTDITGKGALPPAWSFGYWQSKISYKSAEETLEIARQMRRHEIPCDVIHLDTYWYAKDWFCDLEFDSERFPDPKAYLDELAAMGIKISLWQLPYIPEGSKLFDDLMAVDGFVRRADGSVYDSGPGCIQGHKGMVGVIDYTNPRAVEVHQEAFRRLFRLGVKVIKADFGESAPAEGVYHDGTPGRRMHNLYPLLYNKALFEVTKEATGDGVIWGRSAWAGSQRYPLHWGGDNSPKYSNIVPQLEGGLSFGLSGFQFWSQDIGGFCGETGGKMLVRWMQMGLFLSHSRIHGFGDRELYKFDAETVRICRDYLRLRYRLMPYIYGSARRCVAESLPMARALVVEFQDDPSVWNIGDEYLFGDSLLVAPVATEEDRRRVYLPEGAWTDWWTRRRLAGGRWLEVEAGPETLPLYVREGGLVPMGPVMNYVGEKALDRVDLLVALFERDGTSRLDVPVNGSWVPVEYTRAAGRHTVSIGASPVPFEVEALGQGEVEVRSG